MKEVRDEARIPGEASRLIPSANILRAVAGLMSLVFALVAIAIPIFGALSFYNEPAPITGGHTYHWLLGLGAYWFTILAGFVFCVLVSAVLLRYARRGRTSQRYLRG